MTEALGTSVKLILSLILYDIKRTSNKVLVKVKEKEMKCFFTFVFKTHMHVQTAKYNIL